MPGPAPLGLVPGLAYALATDEPTNRLFAVHDSGSYGVPQLGLLTVIDRGTNTVTATVRVGRQISALAVDSQRRRLYLIDRGDNTLLVLNADSLVSIGQVTLGPFPWAVVANPTNGLVYVSDLVAERVAVIDGVQLSVTQEISVPAEPYAIGVSSASGDVYVGSRAFASVTVIGQPGHTIVATIPVGASPWDIAIDETRGRAYVVSAGRYPYSGGDGAITVIDTMARTAITTLALPGGPKAVALDAAANRLLVARFYTRGVVTLLDAGGPTVIGELLLGDTPNDIVASADTTRFYTANSGNGTLSILNSANGAVISTLLAGVGRGAGPAVLRPSDDRVYTVGTNHVAAVDGNQLTMLKSASIDFPIGGASIAINTADGRLYLASRHLIVLDGDSLAVLGQRALSTERHYIAVNAVTDRVYVTDRSSPGSVSVYNGTTLELLSTIIVGNYPEGIAIDSVLNQIYVANHGSASISIIDGMTNTVIGSTPVAPWPTQVAVDSDTNRVFVVSLVPSGTGATSSVTVVDGTTMTAITSIDFAMSLDRLVVDSARKRVYVGHQYPYADTIVVIDANSLGIIGVQGSVIAARGLVVSPTTHRLYVVNEGMVVFAGTP